VILPMLCLIPILGGTPHMSGNEHVIQQRRNYESLKALLVGAFVFWFDFLSLGAESRKNDSPQ